MNKIKLLTIISIGLLASNIMLIGFILFKPHKPPHEGPKKKIIEKLQLSEMQTVSYEEMIKWHRQNISAKETEIMFLKNQLYSTLNRTTEDTAVEKIIAQIGGKQIEIEKIHYRHFQDIKSLCRPDQLKYYETLTREIAGLFAHPPMKKHKR
ncbi:MAG TPA: hypothetical protein PL009_13685 [Flavipsychrobacter sp.]|nr:hypothetical protein [Flavipsychrobacter sp.]